jgi:hypothetical protein
MAVWSHEATDKRPFLAPVGLDHRYETSTRRIMPASWW